MKKLFKIIGIIILIPVLLVIGLLCLLSLVPAVPLNYSKKVKTGGEIEAKYLLEGEYKVSSTKIKGTELTKYYYIYYPKKLESENKVYPVVVVLNGTGILPKKYTALFKHLASWGFIVIGNDDGSTGFGKSADETMEYIKRANEDKDSVLYGKIDMDNIGITGHSQGGAGVFCAISVMEHRDEYKTAVALSPTHEEAAIAFGWNYDLTKIDIPILLLAGTKGDFETKMVIPIDKMNEMYSKISSPKVMLRRKDADHGEMLYISDGYVTAWFMYYLQNDQDAFKAFTTDSPEILKNELYQDQKIDL